MAATSQHYYYLGMVDERVGTDSTSWQTNKVGGLPDWTTSALRSLPDLQCPLCSRNMLLVIQIYSPLDKSEWYHRTMYIFCCINPSCWNKQESWKVVRSQERSSQGEETAVPGSSKASVSCDWLEGQDDWGDDGTQPDKLSPQKTCGVNTQGLEAGFGSLSVAPGGVASASSPLNREDPYDCEMEEEAAVEPEPLQSSRALEAMEVLKKRERDHKEMLSNLQQPSAFKSFYISVVEESEIPPGETAVDVRARKLLQEYELGEGNAFRIPSSRQGCMTYAQELYEKAYHNDVVFHRFHKRVRRYPQQLMRFCWEGEPLFICPPPPSWEPKNCEACGARRCFELQAMPALIPSLKIEGVRKLRASGSSSHPATKDVGKSRRGRCHHCDFCDYVTDNTSHLSRHIRIHTGERPFQCHLCPQRFSLNSTLKQHLRTHTGERPYKCHLCSKSFSQRSTLTDHLHTHTGEWPFKCNLCLTSFPRSTLLKDHLRIHRGEWPFKCHLCPQTFVLEDHLNRHLDQHKRK